MDADCFPRESPPASSPAVNCLIDFILVVVLLLQIPFRSLAAYAQQTEGATFDLRYVDAPIPGPTQMIVLGSLPGGWASVTAFPIQTKSIDLRWLTLHEGLAALLWFAIGLLIDRGWPLSRWIKVVISIRAASVFSASWLTPLTALVLVAFWTAFVMRLLYEILKRSR